MTSHSNDKTLFALTHRVQFSETDMAGVVHFANLFRWMEEVEHAFFRSLGLSIAMRHDGMEIGWPRISASCEYHAPARFEDEIELRLRITKLGQKSLNYEVDFLKGPDLIARGKIATVCCAITPNGMTPIPIPSPIRFKLAAASS